MAQPTVDTHPQRAKIIDAVLAGQSCREISKGLDPPLHYVTIARFAQRSKQALAQQAAAAKALAEQQHGDTGKLQPGDLIEATKAALTANPILARIEKKYERYDRWIEGAEKKEDFRTCASIDGTETKALELQARMLGLIDAPVNTTNIAVVLLASDQRQAPARQAIPDAEVIDITPVTR